MTSKDHAGTASCCLTLLGLVLIVLNAVGLLTIPWWVATLPLWGMFALPFVAVAIGIALILVIAIIALAVLIIYVLYQVLSKAIGYIFLPSQKT